MAENEAAPALEDEADCPFCGEQGFDVIGLAAHIRFGEWDRYNAIDLTPPPGTTR